MENLTVSRNVDVMNIHIVMIVVFSCFEILKISYCVMKKNEVKHKENCVKHIHICISKGWLGLKVSTMIGIKLVHQFSKNNSN